MLNVYLSIVQAVVLFWIAVISGFVYIKEINCDPDHLKPLDDKSSCAGRSQMALVSATV